MILFDDTVPTEKLKYFSEYLDFKGKFPIPVKDKFEVIQLDNSISPLRNECEHFKKSSGSQIDDTTEKCF